MKISKMAEEQLAPSWAFEDVDNVAVADFINREYISQAEVERVQSLPDKDLTEDQVVEQREVIEKCAESNSLYHYNSQWSEKVKSALREYATVCGLDGSKFKAVHPEYFESITVIADGHKTIKKEAKMVIDAFHLDDIGDMDHMKESNWESVHKQSNLAMRPSMEGSVIPMRGGEDYYANSDTKTVRGQNSITEPDAIGAFADSEVEDTGARLRRENKERANSREVKHKAWEQGKIDAMAGTDIIPKGSVFPTEVLDAQPGLNNNKMHMGVYSDYDLKDLPDRTDGECLAELNEGRRREIQGAPKEEHDFQPQTHQVRGISDSFAEELKKHIK